MLEQLHQEIDVVVEDVFVDVFEHVVGAALERGFSSFLAKQMHCLETSLLNSRRDAVRARKAYAAQRYARGGLRTPHITLDARRSVYLLEAPLFACNAEVAQAERLDFDDHRSTQLGLMLVDERQSSML